MTLAIQSNGIGADTVARTTKGAIAAFLMANAIALSLAATETRSTMVSGDPEICYPDLDPRCATQDRPVYTIPVSEVKQPTPLRSLFLLLAMFNGIGGAAMAAASAQKGGRNRDPKPNEIVPAVSGDLAMPAPVSPDPHEGDFGFGFDSGFDDFEVAIAPEIASPAIAPTASAEPEFMPNHPIEEACWGLGYAVKVTDEIISARIKRHILHPIARRTQGGALSTNPPKYTEISARSSELWPHVDSESPPIFFADRRGLCLDIVREDPEEVRFLDTFDPDGEWRAFCGLDTYNEPVWMPLSLTANNILSVGGTSGGGKTSLLTCMMASLLLNVSPDDVEIWAFDGKGGQSFELGTDFPHFKFNTIAATPEEWADRLERFVWELDRRATRFAAANAFNLEEYREITGNREKLLIALCLEYGEVLGSKDAKEAPQPIDNETTTSPYSRVINCFDTIGRTARAKGGTLWADTQRPDSELVPSQLRSNMAHAIALKTQRASEGQIILGTHFDTSQLLGKGDCVLLRDGHFRRFQSARIAPGDRETVRTLIHQKWS